MKKSGWIWLYATVLLIYSICSYALTAPNLVLTTLPAFWSFQTWMWQTFFDNRMLLTSLFGMLFFVISISYWLSTRKATHPPKVPLAWWGIVIVALLLSTNALSYDIYNYIFNAKMVVMYHANPHVHVALEYSHDLWTRFMHNTHTPAPYGYGWTFLSLIPYVLGLGKFLLTWLNFKLFSFIGWLFLAWLYTKPTLKLNQPLKWWVLLNPLLLIEVIGNSHNDLWMMWPAILSLLVISRQLSLPKKQWRWGTSMLLLAFSVSIKYASLAVMPVWLILWGSDFNTASNLTWFKKIRDLTQTYWPLFCSVLLFLPLLTPRSQQFHPWYLSWVLVWLPLFQTKTNKDKLTQFINTFQAWWQKGILVLSISSLFRYLPYLWSGEYTSQVLFQQKIITWVPFVLFGIYQMLIGWHNHDES